MNVTRGYFTALWAALVSAYAEWRDLNAALLQSLQVAGDDREA